MAIFDGTRKEFKRYIGPRLRNLVNTLTRRHKADISVCQHCGTKENLESAHVDGRDRNNIIDLVLDEEYSNGTVSINIQKFEERFVEEHQPLEKSILILCRECHRKYDAKPKLAPQKHQIPAKTSRSPTNRQDVLPITFEPSDEEQFKEILLLKKQAIIETHYADSTVDSKIWHATKFSITSNLLRNLRSRHEYRKGIWQQSGITRIHLHFPNDKN